MSRIVQIGLSRRFGHVSVLALLLIASALSILLLGILALSLRPDARRDFSGLPVLRIYCAAGVVPPVERVMQQFNQQFGTQLEITRAGGSGELAGQLETEFKSEIQGGADVYISADELLLARSKSEGIVAELFPLAEQKPVIAVAADSKLTIDSLSELAGRRDLTFGIASNRAAVGKMIRAIAERDGLLHELETNKKTEAENVVTLAQAIVTGSLDSGVLWDTTVNQFNQQNEKPVLRIAAYADPQNQFKSNIAIGVVPTSAQSTLALKFARYLSAPQFGMKTFAQYGYGTLTGDDWEEVPEIHLYFGSMFTPVLEERVRRFAEREGVNIYPRWEGCGKLVASIRALKDEDLFPDAYFACDAYFLGEVQEFFGPPVTITSNDIVMAVHKDVRRQINEPKDLIGKDLRIGICDPDQSALGWLTKEMLSRAPFEKLYEKIDNEAAVTVDVGPTLISQLMAGGLDVALVYRSNIMSDRSAVEKINIIDIDDQGAGTAQATQPWAISKTTRNPNLMRRLLEMIISSDTRTSFEQAGFEVQVTGSQKKQAGAWPGRGAPGR